MRNKDMSGKERKLRIFAMTSRVACCVSFWLICS